MASIRILGAGDVDAYQALRLGALRESPEAFGSTYEEEVERPLSEIMERLARGADREQVVFGAFEGGELVGMIGLARETKRKARHRALVWGMYVAPGARRWGIARALLDALIAHAKTLEGVESLLLGVVTVNESARQLYRSAGFVPFGVQPRAYALDGELWDSELMTLMLKDVP
ncbi:MAG TPA: GNAT family N-acetyltransferase [Longimicrobium sp.]|nr:GNAT family N-acetyltransferase [Longimicrobium sp.]